MPLALATLAQLFIMTVNDLDLSIGAYISLDHPEDARDLDKAPVHVEIETKGTEQIVYYRLGNKGKGKGQGKLQKMVIRRESNKVVFVDTPSTIMVDINVKLSL